MLHIHNARSAKKAARSLEKFIEKLQPAGALKHGQALDALAVMSGFSNWAALANSLSAPALDARLSPMELDHIESSRDDRYGLECAAVAHNGFELRYDCDAELLTYVRICDPLGREIAYWTHTEWEEDAQLVMGAILGALTQGQAVVVGESGSPQIEEREPLAAVPSITDLAPFDAVSDVIIDGKPFFLRYCEAEAGQLLIGPAGDPDEEDDVHHVVLGLGSEQDGFVEERNLTVANLRELTWCTKSDAFVDPAGTTFEFYSKVKFGPRS